MHFFHGTLVSRASSQQEYGHNEISPHAQRKTFPWQDLRSEHGFSKASEIQDYLNVFN